MNKKIFYTAVLTSMYAALLLAFAFLFGSCSTAKPDKLELNSSKTEFRIFHADIERTGLIHVPAEYDSKKQYSLVFGLHGRGGNAKGFQAHRFDEIADDLDFIMVYPNGINGEWDVMPGYKTEHDDLGLFRLLINEFKKQFSIAPDRVYIAGHSLGGFMTYRLAYELSGEITAAAPVAGQVLGVWSSKSETSPDPVSVLHVHSIDDDIVPFNGDPANYALSTFQSITLWRGYSKCLKAGNTFLNKPGVKGVLWSGESPDIEVGAVIYETGGHGWQQGTTGLIADFFYNHPRRGSVVRLDTGNMNSLYEKGDTILISSDTDKPEEIQEMSLLESGKIISTKTTRPFTFAWTPDEPLCGRLSLKATLKNGEIVKSSNSAQIWVTGKNIAGTPVTSASSIENNRLTPDNVCDGNMYTRWSSSFANRQWIKLEWPAEKAFNSLTLIWEQAYAKAYTIDISSDGKSWKTIHSEKNCRGGTEYISFPEVRAEMLRVNCIGRSTPWGFSLWEILVHDN